MSMPKCDCLLMNVINQQLNWFAFPEPDCFFSTTGGCGRGVFVAPLAKHLQHQIHRGPQRSWSTSFMLYILVISGTMTHIRIISYCYVWIIFIQGNHIVGVLTLLSTDDGCFMALQATRLDYFMQLQKEVMTATSSAKFRTEWHMPWRYHPFSCMICMATSGRKEWKNNGCSDLAAIAYFILFFLLWFAVYTVYNSLLI